MSQHIRYGRYPHRNALLGRQNTSAETEYMQGKLPKWAKSVIVAVSEPTEQVSAPPRHTGPRGLYVHARPWRTGDGYRRAGCGS